MVKTVPLMRRMVDELYQEFGPQHWWPAETPFEVMIGAILTQNTAWRNVEKAIDNLNRADLLDPEKLHNTGLDELERLIRPSGFYRQKARRLKDFLHWLVEVHGADIEKLKTVDPQIIRKELLGLNGIGPETADAILLYALDAPVFVVDAYTIRMLARHGLINSNATYDEVQRLAHEQLPPDTTYLNEAHALIVEAGKRHCYRRDPACESCPLRKYLPDKGQSF